jgi:uncharacterized protein YabN with tetrapyrrole methylase and pyrophosphatase domain
MRAGSSLGSELVSPAQYLIKDDMDSINREIVIVGAGINTPAHLSIEAVKVLGTCHEVWTNIPESVQRALPDNFSAVVKSLKGFFVPDRPRIENYNAIVAHIIDVANQGGRIGYLTQGHPLIFDSVAAALIKQGKSNNIVVSVQPAISSIDTVLVDVLYDPAKGLQIYEATTFVREKIAFDTRAALLLLQPSVFGSRMPRLTASAPAPDLSALVTALRLSYPDDHPVQFVRSASATMVANIVTATVGSMNDLSASATLASSLFIPPLLRNSR